MAGATPWPAAGPATTWPCGPPWPRTSSEPSWPTRCCIPNTAVDAKGDPLTGPTAMGWGSSPANSPPVATFWNLAMYDADNFFVDNPLGRYTIGSTTDGLQPDPDGSLTIAIQHQPPTDTPPTGYPPPAGPFNLTLRFYGPDTSVLDGSYRLPAVQRVS